MCSTGVHYGVRLLTWLRVRSVLRSGAHTATRGPSCCHLRRHGWDYKRSSTGWPCARHRQGLGTAWNSMFLQMAPHRGEDEGTPRCSTHQLRVLLALRGGLSSVRSLMSDPGVECCWKRRYHLQCGEGRSKCQSKVHAEA